MKKIKKIIIATHHNMAEGFKDTLNYIAPNTVEVIAISAYVTEEDLTDVIEKTLDRFKEDEQIIVFTDLVGGSVNQEFAKKLNEYNIHLISGINLPLVLSIVLNIGDAELSAEIIRANVNEAKEQIVYVNDSLNNQVVANEDE